MAEIRCVFTFGSTGPRAGYESSQKFLAQCGLRGLEDQIREDLEVMIEVHEEPAIFRRLRANGISGILAGGAWDICEVSAHGVTLFVQEGVYSLERYFERHILIPWSNIIAFHTISPDVLNRMVAESNTPDGGKEAAPEQST